MKSPHKHHIIPKYHCKELGIDPDFDDNFVTIERIDHAQIHWEYYNGGYETLLKYIKPKPYVLVNIPFGDKRDVGAAVITAKGEIDGIDMSGKNHPRYGKKHSPETLKKMSEQKTGKNNPRYGKKHSPETLKKMSEQKTGKNNPMYGKKRPEHSKRMSGENNSFYGKTHSEEHKQKYMYGEKNPMYGRGVERTGKNNPMYGKKHSDEAKRKQRDAALKREAKKKAERQGALIED